MLWTRAMEVWFMVLFDSGKSHSQIASIMGISRNACIGKAQRLGLSRPPPIKIKPPQPIDIQPAPPSKITIMELTNETCRWPFGYPPRYSER